MSLGVPVDFARGQSPEQRASLTRYAELLLERNAALNLTAARSPEEVAEHLRDSLTLVPYVRGPLIDIGSGGGFPAIPLAIVMAVPVTLVESVAKKARFLKAVIAALGLEAQVVLARAEDAARRVDLRGHFASATARGVGEVSTVMELTVPFLEIGGIAVLQRGRALPHERDVVRDASLMLGAELAGEERLGGPSVDGRRLLLVRKVAATDGRFPRRAGVPAKRPLCRGTPYV